MSVWAIGDIQGCFDELQRLLDVIEFDPAKDQLWCAGDLVNRGPKSAETLRYVKGLGPAAVTVLGNHDLHLQAVALGHLKYHRKDSLDDVLLAPDRDELLHWLRHQPVLHQDHGYSLLHAGLPPQWDASQAREAADELQNMLRSDDYPEYFSNMYGNTPRIWSDDLRDWERLRFITNCFTRLRFCSAEGELALEEKGPPGSQPEGLYPWYRVPGRRNADMNILFGHWSTAGYRVENGAHALDSGCLWGGQLTALRLDDPPEPVFIDCPGARKPGRL